MKQAAIGTESARHSPLWKLFSTGQPLRCCPQDLQAQAEFPIMAEFASIIQLINAYFEIFADAVISRGGEVLKFIGDGLLAIFPFDDDVDGAAAAGAALDAAEDAQTRLEELNKNPPAALKEMSGWIPLRAGIALHEGDIFFGNIGSAERLDFTVVGPAVNEASRVEALNKTIGRGILITEKAARRIDRPLERLGEYTLRGVATTINIVSTLQCTLHFRIGS